MPITEQEIRDAAARMKAATIAAEGAARNASAAHQALADARNAILVRYAEDPKALGANEAARAAALNDMTIDQVEDVRRFEEESRAARSTLAVADIEWSMCHRLVTLAQATALGGAA